MTRKKRNNRKRQTPASGGSIALCMIVRDEEANLPNCLESVRGLVSEINIVDTGSVDNTIAVASRFGANVWRETWANDFSKARNVSLEMARTDWILVLDADEVLSPDAGPKIRAAVQSPHITGYVLPTRNYMNDSTVANFVPNDGSFQPAKGCSGWVESRKARLFRNLPHIRFEGELHEVVGPSIRRSDGREKFLDAIVHHFGYLVSAESIRKKTETMAELAEAKCASQPGNFKAFYELGVIQARLGDLEQAERCFKQSIELRENFALAHYDLGTVFSRANRHEEAAHSYRAALRFEPDHPDAMSNLGDSLQRLRRDEDAERVYRELLQTHPSYARGWNNFGSLLASTGRLEQAEHAFVTALEKDPNYVEARQNLESLKRLLPQRKASNHSLRRNRDPADTVSLCMIVRNEEKRLPSLLSVASEFVDEIIVVDTGSSDSTRAVAKQYGAIVYEFEWTGDFSEARNFSLSKASSDWILVLDADEMVARADFERLGSLLHGTKATGFSFITRNYSRDSSLEGWQPADKNDDLAGSFPGWFPSEKVRLFRNTPSIRFEGEIHELVEPSLHRRGGSIVRADIAVHHYGYDNAAEKIGSYLASGQKKAAANPESAQTQYEFGSVLYRAGRFDEASKAFGKAVHLAPGNVEYLVSLGDSLRARAENDEAESAYRRAIALRADAASAHRGLGIVLFNRGHLHEAREAFEKALELNAHDCQSLTNIGVICARQGNVNEARRLFERALSINPQHETAQKNLEILSASPNGNPTLCLLMIVRDERENVSELLPALASRFDEVVIADTGSSDGTLDVARKHTDKVYSFEWTDDFSAARNFALERAESDWILWLDADDRISPEDVMKIRRRLDGERKGFFLTVSSKAGDAEPADFLQLRVFPRLDGVRWEGRVHEQILPSLGRTGIAAEVLPGVVIVHTGYDDQAILREKTLRNLRLLELENESNPDDRNVLHHLAQAHAVIGDYRKAIKFSKRLAHGCGEEPADAFLVHALNRLAQYHLFLGDTDAAEQWAARVLQLKPEDALARYLRGEICYRKGATAEAVKWFEEFLAGEFETGFVPVPWSSLRANAHNYRGLCFERTGQADKAVAEFRDAIRRGARLEAYKNLARIHLKNGAYGEAAATLREASARADCDSAIWTNLGVALARLGELDEAGRSFRKALELDPQNAAASENLLLLKKMAKAAPLRKSFTLSTCMIARNEAGKLADAIESAAPISDEIIVVDTGSTDDTVHIAERLGAIVKTIEWGDDFSAARNEALRLASSEWILVIDADEALSPSDLQKFSSLKPGGDVWGYSMTTRNYSADRRIIGWRSVQSPDEPCRGQPGWFPSAKVRLFRNLPEIRFEGAVHECVEPSIMRAGGRIEHLDIPVHHYGYIDENKRKREKYLRMAEAKANENPTYARAHSELGVQHVALGNFEQAAAALSDAVNLDPKDDAAFFNLGTVNLQLGKLTEARESFERAIELNKENECAFYNLGVTLERLGCFDEAERMYRAAVTIRPDDSNALAKLGYLSAKKGEYETSSMYLRRALELHPENRTARNNLEYVSRKLGKRVHGNCRLSLNIIVKDEEDNLREGLAPVASLFDEVVVVDTGSCDNTVQTAEELGARVIRHPWNDDFAEARNAALRESNGDWIFWLDADDRIDAGAVRTLRKFVDRGAPCGVFFPLESRIGANGTIVQNYSLRLFPRKPGITWKGAVHEQIADALREAGIDLVNCPDFTIRHVGYEREADAVRKNLRNMKMLARELAARPEDPYVLFALAQGFLFFGQTKNAAQWLRTLWEIREKVDVEQWNDIYWMAAVMLSDCAHKSGDKTEAESWLARATELRPDNWLPYFLLGERKLLGGDREHAGPLLEKAAAIGVTPTVLPLDVERIRVRLREHLTNLKERQ